ncbi:MAG: methionyl-tRNA formyltransferase [Treponemataceae bacterium]|nr:MAG: methionyl-tRNA formyltransferase [Treponemataceae bacterium]
MNVLYAGSPEISAKLLKNLHTLSARPESAWKICAVLSNPPSLKGRHSLPTPTAVAEYAASCGLPVLVPEKLDEAAREAVRSFDAALLVCFSFGKIFGPKFLQLFPLGGINVHPSLLPKYRGATPAPSAILAGERESGVSIQKLALKMDSGNILAQQKIALEKTDTGDIAETTQTFLEKSVEVATGLLTNILDDAAKLGMLPAGSAQQEHDATYCSIFPKEAALIDWSHSALDISRKVRAFSPNPAAFTELDGVRFLVHKALPLPDDQGSADSVALCGTILRIDQKCGILVKCGDGGGTLALQIVQKQGKKMLDFKDFVNGNAQLIGKRLGVKA